MSGQASSSQLNISLSGSSAMSHVYIQYPPLHCSIPGSRGLYYDDGNKLLLSPMANQVFSWKVVPFTPHNDPASDPISEGPILSIRYSLDEKYIAIQRSSQEIQIQCKESGETFSYSCRSELESILGFFWTDCPLGDIVIVKTSGLEIYSCDSESKSLHLIETRRFNVSWYVYTHESRLVLLASGMQCTNFKGFQLSAAGIVRLPKFEMVMAKAEANSKPVLASEDVYIATIYGRIYCMQIDRVAMLLRSYRFYRDAVVQQGSFPIYSSKIAVSVVDNVLLIHQVDAKVVILYDIFSDSRAPISAPLPLLLRGLPRSNTSPSISREGESSVANNVSDREAIIYGEYWTFLVPDLICDVTNKLLWKINLDLEAISASSSEVPSVIEFLQRRKLEANKVKQLCFTIVRSVILERRPVSMVAKAIDVLVSSYSYSIKMGCHVKGVKVEQPSPSDRAHVSSPRSDTNISTGGVGEFGKSMKHESSAGMGDDSLDRPLNFSASDSEDGDSTDLPKVVKEYSSGADGSCADVRPFSSQFQQVGMGNSSLNAIVSEQLESQVTSPAISPDEMYSFVFAPVEEEMVGDSSYLITIIVEFLRSANVEKIKVDPNIYVLLIQLIARNERYAELTLFVVNKIIEPSKEVAMQLLESGRQNFQTRKLGMDMLRQLSLHHDYALQLVQDGYYLEALRYARKFKVITIRPSLFLEAALASNDSERLAAVMRFFTDFVPGFRQTSDHHAYYRILHEMNSSVAS